MEMVIDAACHGFADALDPLQIRKSGAGDAARRAEMMKQRLFASRADAENLVERRATDRLHPLGTMRADGEAMRLIAQTLQIVEHGIFGIEAEGLAPRSKEALAPGVAVGSLGDRRERDVGDAEIGQHLLRR